jgi:hypothetical protein
MTETNHWAPGAAALQGLSDDQFLAAWHESVLLDDKERLELIESNARQRFTAGDWRQPFAARYPDQTRYSLPERVAS